MHSEAKHGARIWFDSGRWWFRSDPLQTSREISTLIRRVSYVPASVAAGLPMGDRSFRRLVVECLGIPPGRWLRIERAVAARHLLREGRPVKQVSYELGFGNQSEFRKEFRRWYGVNPSRYQRAQVEDRGVDS